VHRGVKPEGVVGGAQVVVDGLRHAHHEDPVLAQPASHPEGVLTADRDQGVHAVLGQGPLDLLRAAVAVRVGARCAQDGAPERQDVLHIGQIERLDKSLHRPPPTVPESDDLVPMHVDPLADHRPDHRIEARAVPTPREYADTHNQFAFPLVPCLTA
jgi:hypothetical protein